ncbi:MAG TPA: Nif3-like dinuclear metal center hexameric protein [Thermoleophilaceae bacterium]|jgi:dinuclear metal center YbgI/SA1388 family protein
MAHRDEIVAHLDELLDARAWDDYGPNGLQVTGREEVELVVTGVSAHRELFERAAAAGAGMVLCHHGIFWRSTPQAVGPQMKGRLKALFDADMSLAAYHLPLDAHEEVGNNVLICAELGLRRGERFSEAAGRPIGFVGHADATLTLDELARRCAAAFGREPLVLPGGEPPGEVRRVGIVSGGGGSALADAAALGLDALVTGEPEEPAMADAAETGVSFLACGHYATETFGIRRLGEVLAERFGVRHTFIEVRNPV